MNHETDHTVSSDGKNAPLRLSNVIEEKPWNANISVSQLELILQKTSKYVNADPTLTLAHVLWETGL